MELNTGGTKLKEETCDVTAPVKKPDETAAMTYNQEPDTFFDMILS